VRDENDALAEESDEIETLLFEKFRVRGGGRTLVSGEALEAAQYGVSMTALHCTGGMPLRHGTATSATSFAARSAYAERALAIAWMASTFISVH